VALFQNGCAKIVAVSLSSFATMYLTNVYENTGRTDSDAQDVIGTLNLVANIISMLTCMVLGPLADRWKIFKLMLAVNLLVILGTAGMIYDILSNNYNHTPGIGKLFFSGYFVCTWFCGSQFLLSNTLLAKTCNPLTRGTIYGFNSCFGSIFIASINAVGAYFFKVDNSTPFLYTLSLLVLL